MKTHSYVVMLTQRCNFRCTYCYQAHEPVDQERIVLERIASFLQKRREQRSRVIFHGGEPLLRKDLIRHGVSLLLDEGGTPICTFGVVTNGSLIDEEMLDLFCRYGFEVSVSFDGCREAQAFRDRASFDRVVANLRELVALHDAGRLKVDVPVTVTLENLPYLSRSMAFLTELGIPSISIEGDLYGPWIEGKEQEVERQVEEVVCLMEQRVAAGLPVPVGLLQPRPYDPVGNWWETDGEASAKRESRLAKPECSCTSVGGSVIHADGSSWACPLFVHDLSKVAPARLASPDSYRYGSWESPSGPASERIQQNGKSIQMEPIMGPKRGRYSIFSDCASCPYVADCSVCPAASHLPDAQKPAEEVPPLLCALNMAFLSRRDRIRRPPTLMDVVLSVASARREPVVE